MKDMEKKLHHISSKALIDEKKHIKELIEYIDLKKDQLSNIQKNATKYARHIRTTKTSGMESFIQQYSLSNEEGVAMMCLAEALLRIPDTKTANELVEDKLKGKNWKEHLGQSDSTFVNASTWGLMLTGKIVNLSDSNFILSKLINRMGEPVILTSLKQAMKLISNEFIMGSDMPSAVKRANEYKKDGYRISFDILGESSRTEAQAQHYYDQYLQAVDDAAAGVGAGDLYDQPNLSVKLSALHPRVELRKEKRAMKELLPRLVEIAKRCRNVGITMSFDAEEAFRQDIYLKLLYALITHDEFKDYNGIGFVVQGYQKRVFYIIDFISELAKKTCKRIPIRLVKGAYWDTEIKHAQEFGATGYPVFTRKEFTDVSYLACAQKILKNSDVLYPQFATHNAHTIAAIKEMAGDTKFEFQKLQGMGQALHDQIISEGHKCRIYAPVGKYEALLAYLMRRLLENGANTSFVNLVGDKKLSVSELVENPITASKKLLEEPSKICLPEDIFGDTRKNALGEEPGYKHDLDTLGKKLSKEHKNNYDAISIIGGKELKDKKKGSVIVRPANNEEEIGKLYKASDEQLKQAIDTAESAFPAWTNKEADERSDIIANIGDLMFKKRHQLYSLLMREGGKNLDDAISEVREAIDFARYYASQARKLCGQPQKMMSCTGETNELSLHGRGIFVCISPWNFPLAIFSGQILAALATGNTVLAKPAADTSIIATETIRIMHEAGIPEDVLNLLIVGGRQISEIVLPDNRVKGVVFTGSTSVALGINRTLAARDTAIAPLIAETGGQNAMIVDSSALLEQVTDSVIHSAFGSIGQRCSALRVLYVQEEIFEPLIEMIEGAMNELKIGDTTDLSCDLGPVISKGAYKELMDHISDMKKSKKAKILAVHQSHQEEGYENGSFLFPHIIQISNINDLKQENFGAILHVIPYKAKDLDKVIDEVNSTGFGLTFGVHSRIEDKIHYISSRIKAGNIYANRTMIGAQVESQPFGGEGNSGTGFKAGGPHYLLRFMTERTTTINTTAIGGNIELLS